MSKATKKQRTKKGVEPSAVQPFPDSHPPSTASQARASAQRFHEQERVRQRQQQAATAAAQILPKVKLQDLVSQIDPRATLDADVEELLMELANDFVEKVVAFSCQLAKHRGSSVLEAKDVQLHLERNWGIFVPGFGGKDDAHVVRPRGGPISEAHRQRLMAVSKEAPQAPKRRRAERDNS